MQDCRMSVYEVQFYNDNNEWGSEGITGHCWSVKSLSPSEMAGDKINDNFAAYAYWRSNIDKYKIYRNLAEESLHELKEKTLVWRSYEK